MKNNFKIKIAGKEDGTALYDVEIDMDGDVTAIINALEVALCRFMKSNGISLHSVVSSLKKAYKVMPEREEK